LTVFLAADNREDYVFRDFGAVFPDLWKLNPMAKPLVFQLGDRDLFFTLNKVDRSKLYGFKEVQAIDPAGDVCDLATLAGDGCTLIGRGGTGLGWLDADRNWRDKSSLTPVDSEGNEIKPVASSFSAPIKLFETATVEEYLEHNIRLVYSLESDSDLTELKAELDRGTIFRFDYSYRGGLEADKAFVLNNDAGQPMMVVGTPTKVDFIGMAAPAAAADETEDGDDVEMMDFDMI
jgi:hypothetical protein